MAETKQPREMDNSGRGPLYVPGFGGLPIHHKLPKGERFRHGPFDWKQPFIITAQELAMVAAMNWVTDKPNWVEDVFRDDMTMQWLTDLYREHVYLNPRLMKGKTWDWCVKELRDKATYLKENGHVRVLDTGTCVCKADSAELQSLSSAMQEALVPLVRDQERRAHLQIPQVADDRYKTRLKRKREANSRMWAEIFGFTDEISEGDVSQNPPVMDSDAQSLADTMDSNLSQDDWVAKTLGEPPQTEDYAEMITTFVDPLLYPLVHRRTAALQDGGVVPLDSILETPRNLARESRSEEAHDPAAIHRFRTYQSLPCEVAFVSHDGVSSGGKDTDIKITSYINGLHPDEVQMYSAIEKVLSRAIRPWNDCLMGDRNGDDHSSGLGPIPARIVTYGFEWSGEMPEWTIAFRVPETSEKEKYREGMEAANILPEWSIERQEAIDCLHNNNCRYVVGKEHLTLPPHDSELWQRVQEYLMLPSPCYNEDGNLCEQVAGADPDFVIGHEKTWAMLKLKTEFLLQHKHPEPGTAFSYEDWRQGLNCGRPVVESKKGEDQKALLYKPYHVSLQDEFRDQGLQVIIEISGIDLTPDKPAYAPELASEIASKTATTLENIRSATGEGHGRFATIARGSEHEGWRLAGGYNEHIAAVALFAIEVTNITDPRMAFRQDTRMDYDDFECGQCIGARAHHYFNADIDPDRNGPAHLYGKDPHDVRAIHGEIFGMWSVEGCWEAGYTHDPQTLGSVALSQGRLITFPNVMEHRLQPFRLADETKPGQFRWLKISLVDPNYRLCSTRNVPPQQHEWWADAAARELAAVKQLPQELVDGIFRATDHWPMGTEEAQQHREQMRMDLESVHLHMHNFDELVKGNDLDD